MTQRQPRGFRSKCLINLNGSLLSTVLYNVLEHFGQIGGCKACEAAASPGSADDAGAAPAAPIGDGAAGGPDAAATADEATADEAASGGEAEAEQESSDKEDGSDDGGDGGDDGGDGSDEGACPDDGEGDGDSILDAPTLVLGGVSDAGDSDGLSGSPTEDSDGEGPEPEGAEDTLPSGSNGDRSLGRACERFGFGKMCDGRDCAPCYEALFVTPKRRRINEPEELVSEEKMKTLPRSRMEMKPDGKLVTCPQKSWVCLGG